MTEAPRVLVLNGPNLNLLGRREPIYGSTTYPELVEALIERGGGLHLQVEVRQTNHEGELVDWLQEAMSGVAGVVLNPAGLTTTSVALRDAAGLLSCPLVECHITNIHAREEWRQHSLISPIADAVIVGAGVHSYHLALRHVATLIARPKES